MIFLKRFEKIFFISLVVIISVSCSSKSKELSSALRKHKNEYGVDNILTLIREKDLESALYESAIAGYSDIVSGLVKYGANIDYIGGDGDTLLMSFCKNGNIEAAKILIDNGADVSITDYNGKTIFDNIKNSKDKRDLISYMNRGQNIEGADELSNIENSDLRFNSDFAWGTSSLYDYYTGWTFETKKNVYLVLTVKASNKDLYIINNTIKAYIGFPKPNNNEYTINFEKGKSINQYEDDNHIIYELELELYEDANSQNKAIDNQFVFKVVANKPITLSTALIFPEPYENNNKKSSVDFYEAQPKFDLRY